MGVHAIRETQVLPIPLREAWDFFSRPENLKTITPPHLGFEVLNSPPAAMYAGLMIQYRVRPLFGIPLTWVTEITHVEQEKMFVDEQRIGPYRMWHHEHHFAGSGRETTMTDIVTYVLPFGPLGDFAHALFVKRQLRDIFAFRRAKTEELFGKPVSVQASR